MSEFNNNDMCKDKKIALVIGLEVNVIEEFILIDVFL